MSLIPKNHPRAKSLQIRERLVEGFDHGLVAKEGLMAQL
jgi:4-phosphopantoate--beta-alanine ligase